MNGAPVLIPGLFYFIAKTLITKNLQLYLNDQPRAVIRAFIVNIILFFYAGIIFGNADSLYLLYKKHPDLNKKTEYLLLYGEEVLLNDIDSAHACARLALDNARKLRNDLLETDAHLLTGYAYEAEANYKESLTSFLNACGIAKKTGNKHKLAQCYTAMGVIYWYQGFYDKAEEYYKKNIVLCRQLGDSSGLAASYGNLAILFDERKDPENALIYYQKALEIFDPIKKPRQRAACLDNMSLIYKQKKDFKYALMSNRESYEIRERLQDSIGMLASMNNLGSIYVAQGKLDDAITISEKVLNLATRMGSKQDVKAACLNLRDAFEEKKDYKSANFILSKLMSLNDSIRNAENASEIAELEARFKTKEKETELTEVKLMQQLTEKENEAKLKRKNIFILSLSVIGLMVLVVAFLFIRRFREKKLVAEEFGKKNLEIETQKSIIDKAFQELSEKSKDITDSIKYAKRIQKAIFPSNAQFKSILPNSFVFFKPKDIVSGDFYWLEEFEGSVYFAVVDCTGHGVPGAFMSIVGFNLLNKAIHENKCKTPAEILDQINIDLTETLKQSLEESTVKDGMEISLCRWQPNTNEFSFAGANTIIYKVADGKLDIIRGDKHPIGNFYGEKLKPFTNISVSMKVNDCVYLFSDGFADQFGGEKGKKYKYKQLEELLLTNSDKTMIEQRLVLSTEFARWKGNLEQVDDVCVLGFKI